MAHAAETTIAILAKAPIPGLAKTRLIPEIGAHAAAVLQERLTARIAETAVAANLGPVVLWAAPDLRHAAFAELATRLPLQLLRQPEGDLGARMLAAIQAAAGPVLVVGTDCPALDENALRRAAAALGSHDLVAIPAEDGGYVLIGGNMPEPRLFTAMTWGTDGVMAETRRRIAALGLSLHELAPLWDVDDGAGLMRLERAYPELAL
jgi:rSAM/selenodomain-associated transferase 1